MRIQADSGDFSLHPKHPRINHETKYWMEVLSSATADAYQSCLNNDNRISPEQYQKLTESMDSLLNQGKMPQDVWKDVTSQFLAIRVTQETTGYEVKDPGQLANLMHLLQKYID